MHLTKSDIEGLDRVKRLNMINSVTGIKPANLIGTTTSPPTPSRIESGTGFLRGEGSKGNSNLAIFSSVVHLGSNPALLGFILRPTGEVPRHTYENILATGVYTINAIPQDKIEAAHLTSAKYDRSISEFEECGFTEEYLEGFAAPFVQESPLKLGMKYLETIPIPINGTALVIGSVEHLIVADEAVAKNGYINLETLHLAGISGLNSYYSLEKMGEFPYARVALSGQ